MKVVGQNVLKRADFLNLLSAAKNKKRRSQLIQLADAGEIHSIVEIIRNLLKGNITLNKKEIRKLKKYCAVLRSISLGSKKTIKDKKKVLTQHGGFLPLLIPLALTALSKITNKLF